MPTPNSNIDDQMVDWLYKELAPEDLARFESQLESDDEIQREAEALQAVRHAFRGLSEEEPPASISAQLMHAAAKEMHKEPTIWQRISSFLQPVFLHPAASAMATLVIVGGVAGMLYTRGGQDSLEPTIASRAERPAMAEQVAFSQSPGANDRSLPVEPLPVESTITEVEEVVLADKEESKDRELGRLEGRAEGRAAPSKVEQAFAVDVAPAEKEAKVQHAKERYLSKKKSKKSKNKVARPYDSIKKMETQRGLDLDGTVDYLDNKQESDFSSDKSARFANAVSGADSGAQEDSVAPVAAPVTAPMPKRAVSKNTPSQKAPAKPRPLRWEATKRDALNVAAKNKRCQEAGRIANDILDRSPSFYRQSIANSGAVRQCRRLVASETQRRSKARARRRTAAVAKKKGAKARVRSKAKADRRPKGAAPAAAKN